MFFEALGNPGFFWFHHQEPPVVPGKPTARLLVQQASLHQAGEDLYIEFEIKLLEQV